MMAKAQDAEDFKLQKHSSGVCHRCGWRGPVVKVGRRDRTLLHTSKGCRRLCDDCVDDLSRNRRSTGAVATPKTGQTTVNGKH